jgi:hypothetical protein
LIIFEIGFCFRPRPAWIMILLFGLPHVVEMAGVPHCDHPLVKMGSWELLYRLAWNCANGHSHNFQRKDYNLQHFPNIIEQGTLIFLEYILRSFWIMGSGKLCSGLLKDHSRLYFTSFRV